MPSKNFSHFSRRLVLTNGRFWYLRTQKVIFPQPLDLIFSLSLSKKKKKCFCQVFSKNQNKKKKRERERLLGLPVDIKGMLHGETA